jgi:hypothetical protein
MTGHIERFAAVGNFASYARCVDSPHMGNGKKMGEGNTENGNATWRSQHASNTPASSVNQSRYRR